MLRVLHAASQLVLALRCCAHPPGTQISDERTDCAITGAVMVKGFATIDHVALINVEGTGMVGVVGIASSIFSTVRDAGANVIMISQASSEHSVCFAVRQAEADRAVLALNTKCVPADVCTEPDCLVALHSSPNVDVATGNEQMVLAYCVMHPACARVSACT